MIYDELCQGKLLPASREAYLRVIDTLRARGAQAIILGCTEIALLLQQHDCSLPLFDTAALHAHSAARWMLAP